METSSVQNAVESILDAKCNVLILGTPGSGKSGVVQWVVRHLEKNYVPVLPLRLDRVIPKTNSYQYGIDLGLPASPVHCLSCVLSSGQNGILILDQMDSLRWTGIHAPKALSICGEMIRQAQVYNAAPSGGQIRVICICRTFDLENTQEINRLFCVEEIVETNWDKVYINGWTEEDILKIIGIKKMSRLLPRTIELLKSPNNLSIWLKLSEDVQQTQLNSEYDLVEKWYQQVMSHAQLKKLNIDRIDLAISEIVTKMQDRGNVPETALKSALQCERDFCSSEGIIIQRNGQVVFPHQSVPDYFRVKDMIKGVYARENIEDIVLRNCEKQMYHAEKTDKIKCCVAHGVNDGNPAVRYVLLDCVSLFLGRDNTFAWKSFTKLVSLDIRIIGHHHVSYFVIEFFAEGILSGANRISFKLRKF